MSGPCVLDAGIVIAALDRADALHERATAALSDLIEGKGRLWISAVNYAEALIRPAQDEGSLRIATDAIAGFGVEPVAATAAIARDAARLRGRGISLPDGFAVATAIDRSATCASFDTRVLRVMSEAGIKAPQALA